MVKFFKAKCLFVFLIIVLSAHTQKTYVPDDIFENYLETIDDAGNLVPCGFPSSLGDGIANNDSVLTSKISGIINLYIPEPTTHPFVIGLQDLTGIQDFQSLQHLIIEGQPISNIQFDNYNLMFVTLNSTSNALDSISFYGAPNLLKATVYSPSLEYLDTQTNPLLQELSLNNNSNIEEIDLSNNEDLLSLQMNACSLSNLDISNNHKLSNLNVNNNNLSFINFSVLNNLVSIYCRGNLLSQIDASNLDTLWKLDVGKNDLNSLDLSACNNLGFLHCDSNQLTCLNLKNVHQNSASPLQNYFRFLDARDNPSLSCIEVDDPLYSSYVWGNSASGIYQTFLDPQHFYSVNCSNSCSSSALNELSSSTPVQLIKICDMLGRDAKPKAGNAYLYYYSDGSVTKKIYTD